MQEVEVCVRKTETLITFFLVQHGERLHQLMFGTLNHAHPGFAFFLKRSEQTKKKKGYDYNHVVSHMQIHLLRLQIHRPVHR